MNPAGDRRREGVAAPVKFGSNPTNEEQTTAFEMLCDYMGADDPVQILGYCQRWRNRWQGDDALDSGILWDVTPRRMGNWAAHPQPEKFGNGLLRAGYVVPVETVYPPELLKGRGGFVVPEFFDAFWTSVHRKRSNAALTCIFLQDREKRSRIAAQYNVDPQELPKGWLDMPPPEQQGDSGATQGRPGVALAPPPPYGTLERKETSVKHRNVGEARPANGTGNGASLALLAEVRELKNGNPLAALRLLDGTKRADHTWKRAVDRNPHECMAILSEITEDDSGFLAMRCPAAVVTKKIKQRVLAS